MATKQPESLVLVSKQNGLAIIPQGSPLTRLNYFDGKFLRANDLKTEQDYLRQLVQQSNQAAGSGVVHGFDLTLGGGDLLNVGPGLAIDGEGRVLLMPQPAPLGIQELIDKSRDLEKLLGTSKTSGAGNFENCEMPNAGTLVDPQQPGNLYLIVISSAEALCGEADVYGKLCEEACVTSTDRPFVIEGVIVRALKLELKSQLPNSRAVPLTQIHLRSRVASTRFADERDEIANLISSQGLKLQTWCLGAAGLGNGDVPIGVLARAGATTMFLDPWIVRRELMETPTRRYWQWRMMMRPWDVFLAQVLQFQCQLRDVAQDVPPPGGIQIDPCGGASELLKEATAALAELQKFYQEATQEFAGLRGYPRPYGAGLDGLEALNKKLKVAQETLGAQPENQWLINRGIIELPSAGYLPVLPGAGVTINQQVRRMMGEGVDLRFCVVRPDYVAHALESAQHMDRISLIDGLENSQRKPEVDILVPDGEIIEDAPVRPGAFEATLQFLPELAGDLIQIGGRGKVNFLRGVPLTFTFNGAARQETTASGGLAFYSALLFDDSFLRELVGGVFKGKVSGAIDAAVEAAARAKAEAAKKAGGEIKEGTAVADQAEIKTRSLFSQFKDTARQKFGSRLNETAQVRNAAADSEVPRQVVDPYVITRTRDALVLGGIWMSLTCDRDPRKAQPNDTVFVSGRFVIAGQIPSINKSAYIDIHFYVDPFLVVEANNAMGEGMLSGEARVRGEMIAGLGDEKENDSRTSTTKVSIKWKKLGSGASIEIEIPDPDSAEAFIFSGSWQGSPTTIEFGKEGYFDWELKPNADVLKLENERHQNALTALTAIGSALKDSLFFPVSSKQLFPAPPKPTDQLSIRGTRDWVLFHRRRTKQCSTAAVAPPNRRYRVYQFAATPERLKQFGISPEEIFPKQPPTIEEVLKSAPYLQFFVPIGEATFGGGVATLVGDTSGLKTAWNKVADGKILWGAVASRGDALADGDALAQFRLTTVESTLDQVNARARADVLPVMPPALSSADVDGVILLVNGEVAKAGNANLQIAKSGQLTKDTFGAPLISYEIVVTNAGPAIAQEVVIVDPVPANTTFVKSFAVDVSQPWTFDRPAIGSTGDVIFRIASIPVNVPHRVAVVVKPGPNVKLVMNSASVTSATTETQSVTISTSIIVVTTPPSPIGTDVGVTLMLMPGGSLHREQIVSYLAVVSNHGPAVARNVRLTVPIPANLTFRDVDQVSGTPEWAVTLPASTTAGEIALTTPTLNLDDSAGFSIEFKVNRDVTAASIINEVTVVADTDQFTFNNKAQAERAVTTLRNALVILARSANLDHLPDTAPASRARIVFEDDNAQGQALAEFALTNKSATIVAIDSRNTTGLIAGEDGRATAVRDAMATAGALIQLSQGINSAPLSNKDRSSLNAMDATILNGIDEVIFLIMRKL
ncbi:MAG TPA: hypothetical protein VGO68_21355 [Pyrinomonadaceae bacterium]|jgi:uncharacterized repeat protein (TIGR01451 family)|nr:hypothetical protein [Pyrinomonadaceae bacterium]